MVQKYFTELARIPKQVSNSKLKGKCRTQKTEIKTGRASSGQSQAE
jgi:hypothetical protein